MSKLSMTSLRIYATSSQDFLNKIVACMNHCVDVLKVNPTLEVVGGYKGVSYFCPQTDQMFRLEEHYIKCSPSPYFNGVVWREVESPALELREWFAREFPKKFQVKKSATYNSQSRFNKASSSQELLDKIVDCMNYCVDVLKVKPTLEIAKFESFEFGYMCPQTQQIFYADDKITESTSRYFGGVCWWELDSPFLHSREFFAKRFPELFKVKKTPIDLKDIQSTLMDICENPCPANVIVVDYMPKNSASLPSAQYSCNYQAEGNNVRHLSDITNYNDTFLEIIRNNAIKEMIIQEDLRVFRVISKEIDSCAAVESKLNDKRGLKQAIKRVLSVVWGNS